jgi:tRNA-specific 2-thiouridylase
MKKRVVIGLSGGVDSSVAAHLLVEQGYEVIALFMRNWNDDSVIISEDSYDAMQVAQKLNIPFHILDLSEEYKVRIVDYMIREYEKGYTPNPDVLCNREVKFDIFLKEALKLGADFVATGHYCQRSTTISNGIETHHLLAGADKNKDQSYFLCQLDQEQLSKALFPIGHLKKPKVREIAKALDLVTAEKKDSQGLCFIGKVKLPDFLQQQLKPKKGDVIEISTNHPHYSLVSKTLEEKSHAVHYQREDGVNLGNHQGAHYYTIGQRKGLNIGGSPLPLFIIETDVQENVIFVGQGTDHPGLFRSALFIEEEEIHWLQTNRKLNSGESSEFLARIRYRQELEKCTLHKVENGLYIEFNDAQRGISKGQFAAWYDGEELIGSGVIS